MNASRNTLGMNALYTKALIDHCTTIKNHPEVDDLDEHVV
uniref:Uncharacterized protein n=1 Tax=Physcomitrium patens TaxID=3218 RepID=A0A2K1KME5_PHYPA|nr:hypothetical protein PHYPA_005853 [Physcomitrium patens]